MSGRKPHLNATIQDGEENIHDQGTFPETFGDHGAAGDDEPLIAPEDSAFADSETPDDASQLGDVRFQGMPASGNSSAIRSILARVRGSSSGYKPLPQRELGTDEDGDEDGMVPENAAEEGPYKPSSGHVRDRGISESSSRSGTGLTPGTMENGGSVTLLPAVKSHITKGEDYPGDLTPRPCKRRWLMLAIFCAYSFSNAYQWIHLNIIGNVVLRYYNESLPSSHYGAEVSIDWLSMVYMLAYIPLILPATWLLDKKGLRISSIIATFLNCLGAWIKCISVMPDRFPVLMTAQTICAVAQLFVLGIPPRLAAVWFGPNEVSTATSLGVFGNQVGVAVGFLLPPEIVPNSPDMDLVGRDLRIMMYTTAGVTTALFFLVLLVFRERPPRPPSRAQQIAMQSHATTNYVQSLKNLFRHKGFMILVLAYGLNTGCYYAVSTLLNSLVLYYYPNQEQTAGRIGLTLVLAGILGAVVAGVWLDKTKAFKSTTLFIYIMSIAGMAAFTFTMDLERIWVVYITAGSLGFFMTGYLPVGFEYAAEITYPEPEGTSSGILNASAQICGIILTLGMRALINQVEVLYANISMTVALVLGLVLTAVIRSRYRRQEAEKTASTLDIEVTEEET